MKIMIIGTSRITTSHIQALKKKRIKIIGISSTRNKSKNLKKLSKKFLINNTFTNWRKAIDFATQIKDCNFFITARIKDNLKILRYCMRSKDIYSLKNLFFTKLYKLSNYKRNYLLVIIDYSINQLKF